MSDKHDLETLLERLNQRDSGAAEAIYVTYEPYLRMIVRRKLTGSLRSKFDSMDIVQSVWIDLLDDFERSGRRFRDAAHLRAFLTTATRNRFIDRLRSHKTAMRREERFSETDTASEPESRDARPSELIQADDVWSQLLAMCPPAHHELLRLKRQGLPLAEIAARTGLHEGSIRRIIHDLAYRVTINPIPDKIVNL
jgi:RNA polymerase sigma factor (sigma-70 family)